MLYGCDRGMKPLPQETVLKYATLAHNYALDVVEGRIKTGELVRLACERHFNDLVRSDSDDYLYYLNYEAGARWCLFLENLPHIKGRWARERLKITLEPWQVFKTMSIGGWLQKKDDLRRFRRVFILEPRKNAKSTWAAGIGLIFFTIDDDFGSEVYSGATTEKQAWEVFKPARLMVKNTPSLQSAFGITVNASNLHRLADGAKFEPLIGNPGDGSSPSCAIIDEYHEHDTDAQADTMETGMGARDEPLLLFITTAGDNLAGPCYSYQKKAERVLQGVLEDERLFVMIYTVDKDTDWSSLEALEMANPNMGVSVSREFLLDQQKQAVNDPRKIGVFKTKHLNLWVQAKDAYFNTQRWMEVGDSSLRIEDFFGQPVILGLDLASKSDIVAKEYLFRLDECDCEASERLKERGYRYASFGVSYLPREKVDEPENEHYQGWEHEGWLRVTEGEAVDYNAIQWDILGNDEAGIIGDVDKFKVLEVAFDDWQARQMMAVLMEAGLECVEVNMTVKNMSEPMKEVDAEILKKGIAHNGNPVYTWQLSCVLGRLDLKDNVFPSKDKNQEQNKIDNPVAQMMAMARWLIYKETGSVYEKRGILTV